MHVLILTHIDDPFDPTGVYRFGGGSTFVFDLGLHLVRERHRVTYVCRINDPSKSTHERVGPLCDIYRLPSGPFADIPPADFGAHLEEFTAALKSIIGGIEPVDVIHSHYWTSGVVARELVAAKPARHVHNILSLGRLRQLCGEESRDSDQDRDRGEVRVFKEADLLIACSPAELRDLCTLYPEVPHARIEIIPYGLDLSTFFPRPQHSIDLIRRASRRFTEGASILS